MLKKIEINLNLTLPVDRWVLVLNLHYNQAHYKQIEPLLLYQLADIQLPTYHQEESLLYPEQRAEQIERHLQ